MVGSHFDNAFLDRGESVAVIDDLSTAKIADSEEAFETDRCTFIYGDLVECSKRAHDLVAATTAKPLRRVVQFASSTGSKQYVKRPWEALAISGLFTMNLIDLALRRKATFVFTSTAEYGDPLIQPQSESNSGNINQSDQLACYDEAYRFGEAAVSVADRSRNLQGRIVRLFDFYGPRMSTADGRTLSAVLNVAVGTLSYLRRAFRHPTQILTYIEVVADAILLVVATRSEVPRPVNIGTESEYTVAQLISAVTKAGQRYMNFFDGTFSRHLRSKTFLPDVSVARSYRWAPKTSSEEGLYKTLSFFSGAKLAAV